MSATADSRLRDLLLAYFPMFIATLSLITSIYNGYLNSRFVDIIQRNVGRTEYMRTCKEVIDAYFQVKVRVSALNAAGAAGPAQTEAANAVAKFAALATYLANLRDETIRVRYTDLSMQLDRIAAEAKESPKGLPQSTLDGRYARPDQLFSELNDDCIKAAKE